ncbi:response regulator [Paenibacillus antri]|uniref:Response regulator n=1 Tax=Paenibacillus antri TaxID=2582848 RepID=A0A5R9GEI3_9BACL|nr:response regulator [Paenibacillus antri]TLS52766.1 response regulator [Paenibacillus antri]
MYSVMIAEDEEQIRLGLRHTIENVIGGYRVVSEAANGREALEQLHGTLPDILITDIRMPEMGGIELIRKIRASFPGLFIVIVSGYSDFEYAKQAIKYQVAEYLLKPVSRVELAEVLLRINDQLSRQFHGKTTEEGKAISKEDHHVIRKVKEFVLQNLSDDITLQKVAEQVNLTQHYLSALFKTETGQNYSDFVTESRMAKAKLLLRESNLKIHEIAQLTGYLSAKHFMNVFKTRVGTTPSEYRNQES